MNAAPASTKVTSTAHDNPITPMLHRASEAESMVGGNTVEESPNTITSPEKGSPKRTPSPSRKKSTPKRAKTTPKILGTPDSDVPINNYVGKKKKSFAKQKLYAIPTKGHSDQAR